jgi:hypothetical protein
MIQHGTDAAADSRRRDALAALLWGVRWLLVLFVVLEARPADACATGKHTVTLDYFLTEGRKTPGRPPKDEN